MADNQTNCYSYGRALSGQSVGTDPNAPPVSGDVVHFCIQWTSIPGGNMNQDCGGAVYTLCMAASQPGCAPPSTCTAGAFGGYGQFSLSGSTGFGIGTAVTSCDANCATAGTIDGKYTSLSQGLGYWRAPMYETGAVCPGGGGSSESGSSPTAGPTPTPTPTTPPTCPAGETLGTVNGTQTCLTAGTGGGPCPAGQSPTTDQSGNTFCQATPPAGAPPPAACTPPNVATTSSSGTSVCSPSTSTTGGGTTTATNPDGSSSSTTSSTTCSAGMCTTTTSTTTTPAGGGPPVTTSSSSSGSQSSVCAQKANQTNAACAGTGEGGDSDSASAGPCVGTVRGAAVSSCQGDAIECATLQEEHQARCDLEADDNAMQADPNYMLGQQVGQSNDPLAATINTARTGTSTDVSQTISGAQGWIGGGSCFPDFQFTLLQWSLTIPFSSLCAGLAVARAAMLLIAGLIGMKILSRAITS